MIENLTLWTLPVIPLSGLLSWLTLRRTHNYKSKSKRNMILIAVCTALSAVMCLVFGASMEILKGILLADIFLFASVTDIETRHCPDWVSAMILILGLVSASDSDLFWNAVAAITAFAFFFLAAVISKNKIGGADIKFISACMFVLGTAKGLAGLILGLFLAIIGTLIRNHGKEKKDMTLPMLPYLSVGFIISYVLGGILI